MATQLFVIFTSTWRDDPICRAYDFFKWMAQSASSLTLILSTFSKLSKPQVQKKTSVSSSKTARGAYLTVLVRLFSWRGEPEAGTKVGLLGIDGIDGSLIQRCCVRSGGRILPSVFFFFFAPPGPRPKKNHTHPHSKGCVWCFFFSTPLFLFNILLGS